jgi:hypothetical protein
MGDEIVTGYFESFDRAPSHDDCDHGERHERHERHRRHRRHRRDDDD